MIFIFRLTDLSMADCEEMVPIHLHHYTWVKRPKVVVSDFDIELALQKLNIDPNKSKGAFSWFDHGQHAPVITCVGSSHMTHLKSEKDFGDMTSHHVRFLENSSFVAVGGLKFHSAGDELNGIFKSHKKWEKYGNQWQAFDHLGINSQYFLVMCGSNDADDYNNMAAMKRQESHNDHTYLAKVENAAQDWLGELKPHIQNLFMELYNRNNAATIAYIPSLPRHYWCDETRSFASDINHYIIAGLKHDIGIKVKMLPTKSLFVYNSPMEIPDGLRNEVISAFLEEDGTHLNSWGMCALVNDIAPRIMHNWASKLGVIN